MMHMPKDIINDNIVKAIIKKWGTDGQIDVAIEEFAELIVELARLRKHSVVGLLAENIKRAMKASRVSTMDSTISIPLDKDIEDHLAEETADAHIMIEQLVHMFDMWPGFYKKQREKFDRLCKRLF